VATKIKQPIDLYQLLGIDPKWYLKEIDNSSPNGPRQVSLKNQPAGIHPFPDKSNMQWVDTKPKYLENQGDASQTVIDGKRKIVVDISDAQETELELPTNTRLANESDENTKALKLNFSTTIQSAVYWPQYQLLYVSFKSGSSYEYRGVPLEIVEMLESASSHGSFFYHNIRTSFSYHKV
jgi:KTSC domain-containing protein